MISTDIKSLIETLKKHIEENETPNKMIIELGFHNFAIMAERVAQLEAAYVPMHLRGVLTLGERQMIQLGNGMTDKTQNVALLADYNKTPLQDNSPALDGDTA